MAAIDMVTKDMRRVIFGSGAIGICFSVFYSIILEKRVTLR